MYYTLDNTWYDYLRYDYLGNHSFKWYIYKKS